ncbi:MAG: RHS repeat protein, partial [Magnetococcales bacterium]|nr:RHS repeat protein [Magnetococcales bacterium]
MTRFVDYITTNDLTAVQDYTVSTRRMINQSRVGRKSYDILDDKGRLERSWKTNLEPVILSRDSRGRVIRTESGSGTDLRATTFTYDEKGRLDKVTDPLGRVTDTDYDLADRPTQVLLQDGRLVRYEYDAKGNMTALYPPGRSVHRFQYDVIDQPQSYQPPPVDASDPTTTYAYNPDGDLWRVYRPDGAILEMKYNNGGQLTTMQTPQGETRYTYFPTTGQLQTVTTPDGLGLSYTRDGFLVTGETWSGGVTGSLNRVYDNSFRLTSQLVNGSAINFTYDYDDLLTQAGDLRLT